MNSLLLEVLEDRIAPATALFTDVDGDSVTVWTSKGTNDQLQMLVDSAVDNGQMKTLDLSNNAIFNGTSIKISVSNRAANGDGLVNVWHINATGIDLGAVTVNGDLAKLTAGDMNYKNGSVKSVNVQSIGVNGGATDKAWQMLGGTSSFTVANTVSGAFLNWDGPNGSITVGKIFIGGDLRGDASGEGTINVFATSGSGRINQITIQGSLIGTNMADSGEIGANIIGKVVIGGSLKGTSSSYSGVIWATQSLGDVTVGGGLEGGGGTYSGTIYSDSTMGSVVIGGNLTGGSGLHSGGIFADGDIKSARIGGSLLGDSGYGSGGIFTAGRIGNVSAGALIGDAGTYSGAIYGETGLGDVSVSGGLTGGSGGGSGGIGMGAGSLLKSLKVGGDLIGGSGNISGGVYVPNGKIGNVSIGGSLIGGAGSYSGGIYAEKGFGNVSVHGSLEGGGGIYSGSIGSFGGGAGKVEIHGGLTGGSGNVSGSVSVNTLASIIIGGDVQGGAGQNSGSISASNQGKTAAVVIGGNLIGGSGDQSGFVNLDSLSKLEIGGSIIGGSDVFTGTVNILGTLSKGTIGGSIIGGTAQLSGVVRAGILGSLVVGGNVIGGEYIATGGIASFGNMGSVEIKGNLIGGSFSMANLSHSGYVSADSGAIGKITIGGNIEAGTPFNATNYNMGAIAAQSLGTILVKGSLIGNSDMSVFIGGTGNTSATKGSNLAIKSLTVEGSASYANILGGYTRSANSGAVMDGGSAQLGTITILGDFLNSSIATGVSRGMGTFGDGNNTLLDKPTGSNIVASIAKIVINGKIGATTGNGIAAEKIGSFSLAGFNVPIIDGQVGPSANFKIQQVN